MLGQTIRLFIKALIIGVLVNLSLQYASTSTLPYSENTTLYKQALDQAPLDVEFQATSQADH